MEGARPAGHAGPPTRRQILKRLAASIALFGAVLLCSAEVVLRAGGWFAERVRIQEPPGPDGFGVPDPAVGRLLAPNRSGTYSRTEFSYEVRSNSLGFRDEDLPAVKEPGEVRLWIIGDSITSGYGVREEDRFTDLLEKALDSPERVRGRNGRRVRIVNSGIVGLGTLSQAAILEKFIDRVIPDAVLLAFTTDNDFSDNLHYVRWKARGGEFEERADADAGPVRLFFRHHSHFYHLLGTLKRLPEKSVRVSPEERTATIQGLERFRSICAERGLPLTVALVATRGTYHKLARPESYEADTYRITREILREGGFRVVDTIARIRTDADLRGQFFRVDTHPNEAGHARIAEILSGVDLLSPGAVGGS